MKKSIPFFVFAAVILLSITASTGITFSQDIPITILHFSDSHSNLIGSGPKNIAGEYTKGGFDRAATVIRDSRNTDPNVMVFHVGDFSTGSFYFNRYFSVPELTMFKRFNFDAVAVGNHEFDLGPAVLLNSLNQSFPPGSVPFLSANLDLNGYPALGAYISPHSSKIINGVKVGFFGLTINDPSSNPSPVVISDNYLQIAFNTVTALQAEGCSLIICLSHLGYMFDNQLALIVPGIHIILGGHDHAYFPQPVPVPNPSGFNTLVCHAGAHYEYAGKLRITYNNGNVNMTNYQLISLDSNIARDDSVNAYLDSLKPGIIARYGNVFSETVGYALNDISASFNELKPERDTPLGNLVTDAHRWRTGTQISLTAVGLMSESIYRGPVNGEDILRVTPYGYDTATGLNMRLVKFSITGSELKRGLELVLFASMADIAYHPQSSGLTFDYNSAQPVGFKILLPTMKVNDTLLNLMSSYTVTANEGLFRALSLLGISVSNVEVTNINEYTSLSKYARGNRRITYKSEGRIRDVNVTNLSNPVASVNDFELFQNYPNPFNSKSVIKYRISKSSFVSIKIFDVTGRQVADLVNEMKQAGTYSVLFDAAKISSGVYFCRLKTDNEQISVKKMILMK